MTSSAQARAAVHESWGRTRDRAARTAPARTGLLERFERQAREQLGDGATDKQVADAAESIRRAYYQRLSAAGAAARWGRTA